MTVYFEHPGVDEDDLPDHLDVLQEALEGIRRMCASPMKSWDSGVVVDASWVDELAEEAQLALSRFRQHRTDIDPTVGVSWSES